MARHQIAAEFIGQAHDLTQAEGVEAEQSLRRRRCLLDAQLAVELPAELAPQFDEGAERIGGRPEQHASDAAFLAVRRQCAAEGHPIPALRGHLKIDPGGGARATAAGETHPILDRQVDRRGTGNDIDFAGLRVGHQPELDGLKIHHQRIRQDIVRAVGPAIEGCGVLFIGRERGVVDDDVAADRLQSLHPQCMREAPPSLQGHVRVAAALQDQIPLQHSVIERALGRSAGMPGVGRPQQVEGRKGGNDLEGGCRAAGYVGIGTRDHPA